MISYCGANSDGTHAGIFTACASLMVHKYSEMSAEEIREAFRLAASREIEADLTAYKGTATVAIFGGVMAAYKEHRRKYVAEYLRQQERINKERHDQEGAEAKKSEFEKMVVDWFEANKANKGEKIESYNHIPVYYYNTLDDLGFINVNPAAKNAYMSLAAETFSELLKNKQERDVYDRAFIKNMDVEGYVYAIQHGARNHKLEITNIAKRLLLEHIIKGLVENK